MLHSMLPGKTEKGSAGEQPFKGYPGQAHQTMARVGAANMATPTPKKTSDDRPAMPQKTHPRISGINPANHCPRFRARYSQTTLEMSCCWPH